MISRTARAALALVCSTTVALMPASPAHADRIRDDQWHLRYLNVAEAHKVSQGEGVTVAVVDTGVDPHPDLRNNLLPGTDVTASGKGDGRQDPNGHGTKMASLIAAHGQPGNNGALGVAPKAKILPIFARAETQGDNDDTAAGIEWATTHGAKVVSISSGGGPSPRLRQAVDAAIGAGIVVVAAAGNKPTTIGIGFPAAYDGVLAVGATDPDGNHADISVTGRQLAVCAPGVDILSASKGGTYSKGTGTSDSTAIVSGAAALVRSKYPNLSAKEVIHRLTATAIDKGAPGRDEVYGYGVIDLVAALTADVPPLEGTKESTSPSPQASNATALPAPTSTNDRGTTLLITLGVLLAIAVVIAGVFLWRHLRRSQSRSPNAQ